MLIKRLLFLLFLLFTSNIYAAPINHLELGIGYTSFAHTANGIWWQNGFAHTFNMNSSSALLGLKTDISKNLSLHNDFVWLGTASIDSFDTPSDANYSGIAPTYCNGTCLPLVHYLGSGTVYGLSSTLEIHTNGLWQIGFETGPWFYHESWKLNLPNMYYAQPNSNGGYTLGPVQSLTTNDHKFGIGYVVGLNLEYKSYGFNLRYYKESGGFTGHSTPWPPGWKYQTVFMLTKYF